MPTVSHLTTVEVEFIHERVIAASGGSTGIRSRDLLESALARPASGFGDDEFYSSILSKAAVLLEAIIRNHPFVDGNKRTAMVTTAMFLARNDHTLSPPPQDLEDFAVHIAEMRPSLVKIQEWLRQHSGAQLNFFPSLG